MAYTTYTLTDMIAQLKVRYESVPFWSDAEATIALNEAMRKWNMLTGMWKERITMPTAIGGEAFYSLPGSMVYGMRIEYEGRPLQQTTLFDLDNGRPGWQNQSTSDADVPNTVKVWAPISLMLFAIWPVDAVGGHTLTIDGVAATPVMVNPTDDIDMSPSTFNAILGEALYIVAFKEGTLRWQGTADLHKMFLSQAMRENERLNASSLFRHAIGLDTERSQRPLFIDEDNGRGGATTP